MSNAKKSINIAKNTMPNIDLSMTIDRLPDRNPTVRKYPRTMSEAFPNARETAQWIEKHKAPMTVRDVVWYAVIYLIICGLVALLAFRL